MIRKLTFLIILFSTSLTAFGQGETLDNNSVIEMTRSGLSTDLILKKISTSRPAFVVTSAALVELKKAGVDDAVIALMMDRAETALPNKPTVTPAPVSFTPPGYSDSSSSIVEIKPAIRQPVKTIALGKGSLQPSLQAVEKELMKREDFRRLNLTILKYEAKADLFVDIGFVTGSVLTHRYVYRIYDRRSGAVVAAGETTSWGSLAENLARHISKRLTLAIHEGRLT
ncbi:MAG TPA: hypothetical protein VJV05_10290 [Pyrinomonadaceae bacterium]|nr:hypothetical protein [Pyrinomonadaceae bacterium]